MKRIHQNLLGHFCDGLLPAYTQQIEGLPNGNIYKVEHANHIEVTDMSNSPDGDLTKIEFDKIWERDDIFGIDKRGQ
jgi:hypothetical protein